jgi:hemolysin-activating ACP:hemolysin acyltransferase
MPTLDQLLSALDLNLSQTEVRALHIGIAASTHEINHPTMALGDYLDMISPPIGTQQCSIHFDDFLRTIGFVTWANITSDSYKKVMRRGVGSLEPSECTGGPISWVVDFHVSSGHLRQVLEELRDRSMATVSDIFYDRFKRGRRLVKYMSRKETISFFRAKNIPSDSPLNLHFHIVQERVESFRYAIVIGKCLQVLGQASSHRSKPLAQVLKRVRICWGNRQLQLLESSSGEPHGLITWAWLSDYTINQLLKTGFEDLHVSEWNEGTTLCICDVAWCGSGATQVIQAIKEGIFPLKDPVLWEAIGREKDLHTHGGPQFASRSHAARVIADASDLSARHFGAGA